MTRLDDTPPQPGKSVVARFRGTGSARILLLAHMDTVYERGTAARQPFRVEGDRAYGLGIADDKSGVALALHAVAVLQSLDARDYGLITVLVNADEEISSPSSRGLIHPPGERARRGVFVRGVRRFGQPAARHLGQRRGAAAREGALVARRQRALRRPQRALRAGASDSADARICPTRRPAPPSTGRWRAPARPATSSRRPPRPPATARVLRVRDWDVMEARLKERITHKLIPETQVSVVLERRRPPLEASPASRAMAAHAAQVYASIGRRLRVLDRSEGGGTDAAFAALKTQGAGGGGVRPYWRRRALRTSASTSTCDQFNRACTCSLA
jgi:glutamate carboxypeptidase